MLCDYRARACSETYVWAATGSNLSGSWHRSSGHGQSRPGETTALSLLEETPPEDFGTRRLGRSTAYTSVVVFFLSLFLTAGLFIVFDPWFDFSGGRENSGSVV